MTSEYPDAVPIEQIVTMAEGIRQLPLAHLLPHSHQLQRLLAITEEINNAVNRASISLARRSVLNPRTSPPSSNSAPSPIVSDQCTAPTPHIKRSRKVSAARALQAACDIAPILAETIRKQTVTQLEKWCELPSDPRTCHLQPILSFQNDRGQSSVDSTDRIFLATSCQSLASDFAAFEQNHGRVSKHQVLLSQLLAGNSITVQRHGHHHGNFFSSLGDLGCHREKFDAGLLLGTKMRIIQSCAEAAGIGSTLGLLLGYECQSLGRLPYREFSELLGLLQGSRDALQPIIDFSNEFDEWWLRFSNHYHCMHGRHSLPEFSTDSNMLVAEPDLSRAHLSPVNVSSPQAAVQTPYSSLSDMFGCFDSGGPGFEQAEFVQIENILEHDQVDFAAGSHGWNEDYIQSLL